jgi:hypothetical protein
VCASVVPNSNPLQFMTCDAKGVVHVRSVTGLARVEVTHSFPVALNSGEVVTSIECPCPGRLSAVTARLDGSGAFLRTWALDESGAWVADWEMATGPCDAPPVAAWRNVGGGCFVLATVIANRVTVFAPTQNAFRPVVSSKPQSRLPTHAICWTSSGNIVVGVGPSVAFMGRYLALDSDPGLGTVTKKELGIDSAHALVTVEQVFYIFLNFF